MAGAENRTQGADIQILQPDQYRLYGKPRQETYRLCAYGSGDRELLFCGASENHRNNFRWKELTNKSHPTVIPFKTIDTMG